MTIGLPGSGKSTWAKQMCADNPEIKRVNKDDLRSMISCKHTKGNENFVLEVQTGFIRSATALGYHVIVDDTNLHPKHFERIKSLFTIVQPVLFVEDIETCIERDALREGSARVGEKVIRQMASDALRWAEGASEEWTAIIQPLNFALRGQQVPTLG